MERTDKEIFEQTLELARRFYESNGYEVPEGYRLDLSDHPQEYDCWNKACIAQNILTGTDPNNIDYDDI